MRQRERILGLAVLATVTVGGSFVMGAPAPAAPRPAAVTAAAPFVVLKVGSTGDRVRLVQTRLKALGYYDGEVDGNFGSGSKAAIAAVQGRIGMQADGEPSLPLLNALRR